MMYTLSHVNAEKDINHLKSMKPTSLITWNEIYQKIGQMKEREKERNPGEGSQIESDRNGIIVN